MTNKNLTILWTAVGSLCFYYAANTWSMSQGGAVLFPGALIDTRPVPGSYLGAFVVSLLLMLTVRVGTAYLDGKRGRHWSLRFPIVALDKLSPKDGLSRLYQGAFLFLFVILPALSLVHFADKVIGHADIGDRETRAVFDNRVFYIESPGQLASLENYGNRYCMGQDLNRMHLCATNEDYQGGVTWFPLASPIAMLLLSAVAFVYAGVYVYRVFKPPRDTS